VERESNQVILYPVSDRTETTLLPIIERHVEKGATIYSDGWSAYCPLNEMGYSHFTVLHKYAFKKSYINTATNEEVQVHTNRIEGAWKHAKDHFRRMAGTKIGQFEGHLAEIMWRAEAKANVYEAFFDLLRQVYPLNGPAHYHYSTPLFDTWSGLAEATESQLNTWEIRPGEHISNFLN
jgi:transposase-like protein